MIHCKCFLSCMELHDRLSQFIKLFPTDILSWCHQQGCGIEIITLMNHGEKLLSDSQLTVIQQGGNTSVSLRVLLVETCCWHWPLQLQINMGFLKHKKCFLQHYWWRKVISWFYYRIWFDLKRSLITNNFPLHNGFLYCYKVMDSCEINEMYNNYTITVFKYIQFSI
jgi:hypothetical protein